MHTPSCHMQKRIDDIEVEPGEFWIRKLFSQREMSEIQPICPLPNTLPQRTELWFHRWRYGWCFVDGGSRCGGKHWMLWHRRCEAAEYRWMCLGPWTFVLIPRGLNIKEMGTHIGGNLPIQVLDGSHNDYTSYRSIYLYIYIYILILERQRCAILSLALGIAGVTW